MKKAKQSPQDKIKDLEKRLKELEYKYGLATEAIRSVLADMAKPNWVQVDYGYGTGYLDYSFHRYSYRPVIPFAIGVDTHHKIINALN